MKTKRKRVKRKPRIRLPFDIQKYETDFGTITVKETPLFKGTFFRDWVLPKTPRPSPLTEEELWKLVKKLINEN
jgi:hypothetical protein